MRLISLERVFAHNDQRAFDAGCLCCCGVVVVFCRLITEQHRRLSSRVTLIVWLGRVKTRSGRDGLAPRHFIAVCLRLN